MAYQNNSNNNKNKNKNSKWTIALVRVHEGLKCYIGLEYLKKAFVAATLNE